MNDIAKYIKKLRLRLGLTQEQFGVIIGRKRDVVTKYEGGNAIPPGDILLKIQALEVVNDAKALGVDPKDLIKG